MSLHVSRDGRIVEIILDRPPVNALDGALYDALATQLGAVGADDVVLLRSAARHFCTGQDLREHEAPKDAQAAAADLRRGAAAIVAALRCEAPIVAAVHGAAIGAGALLACSADVLLPSDDSWFSLPELQVGVTIGGAVATRTFGGALTRRMLLTGERVPAEQIATAGGSRLVARDGLEEAAREAAEAVARLDPAMVSLSRGIWGSGEREAAAQAYEAEIDAFLAL